MPVGIGPFTFVACHRGDSVELAANPRYFRGRPKLDRILFRIIPDRNTLLTQLQTGEVDLWAYMPPAYVPRMQALPNTASFRGPSYLYAHVTFNTAHPALKEKAVRQALPIIAASSELAEQKIELERFLHLYVMNRRIVMTPFHNMALMSPDTTEADVDAHTVAFASALDELFG